MTTTIYQPIKKLRGTATTTTTIIYSIPGDKFEYLINLAYNKTILWKKMIYASLRQNSKTTCKSVNLLARSV